MIISPPFLPARNANETDAAYLDRAMQTAAHGRYPISDLLGWHGGMHLLAPHSANNTRLPVRAIADGTVAYVRPPTEVPANPESHPLGYNGWTDDGCVIIRHDTSIGAHGDAETTAGFYSVYMHLNVILSGVRPGQAIHRKSELGRAGMFEGEAGCIHFEIICDDENLQRLIGRTSGDLNTDADGRTDAVFGQMYFRLPADTEVYPQRPALHRAVGTGGSAIGEEVFVGIDYSAGSAHVTTYRTDASTVGNPLIENDAEYSLYRNAGDVVAAYRTARATNVPSHSAVYELLRFGRILGPDALNPADTPHWRQIRTSSGQGWVNLNAAGITKFSDADAPHWNKWYLMQDFQDNDSRCSIETIRNLLDLNDDSVTTQAEARQRLGDPDVQRFIQGIVSKFPTEWHRGSVGARWSWLTTEGPQGARPNSLNAHTHLTSADFPDFQRHAEALCFWEDANLGIPNIHWHFHPRKFIAHFRKCGWLSLDELAQLLPRRHGVGEQTATITWNTARARFSDYQIQLNETMRRYCITSADRQTHFLAQTYIETAMWSTMREFGRARQQRRRDGALYWPAAAMEYYGAFFGRGIMQLTWAGNYESYGAYRQFHNLPGGSNYTDNRMSPTSRHYWADPRDRNGVITETPRQWHPRYEPDNIANNVFNACDSGGHYWVSKNTGNGAININRVSDRGITPAAIGRASVLVNGGSFGYAERQQYAMFIARYRGDSTDQALTETVVATRGTRQIRVNVYYTPQRP